MKLTDLIREVLYPLTNVTVLLANVTFAIVAALSITVMRAGPFGLFILPLALITLPALFRYSLYLLEYRAQGKQAPDLGIELFNWVENFWSLFPLVLLAFLTWIEIYVYFNVSPTVAKWLIGVLLLVYPSSVAVLGVTRSPFSSLNPVSMFHMIRLCGPDYLWIPATLLAALLAVSTLFAIDVWLVGRSFAVVYLFFLLFSLTGAVLHTKNIMDEVDIDEPLEPGEAEVAEDLRKERQRTANHAYGFVSRGNRDGGLAHIRQWIGTEANPDDACKWFFHEMLKWESNDAALFFAQEYFAHLLSRQQDADALKLISRCLHEDAGWKPFARDRDGALQLADKYDREDLIRALGS